jgi:uncharacterized protein YndB with AHSA1/START domain
MNTQPIVVERTINASVDKTWKALTDNDEMKQWYFKLPEFRPEEGFEFQFEGGDDKQTYLHLCKITEVIPNRWLKHSWQYEGQPEATWVTWELFDEGDSTRVRLTHEGLEKIAHHGPAFARDNFVAGWTDILGTSLKNHLEQS